MLRLENGIIAQGDFRLTGSFALEPAQFVGVIGASGSGKSTLLGALSGVHSLSGGTLRWKDSVLNDLPPSRRPIGILFQDGNLFPHLPVSGTLALALNPKGRLDAAGQAAVEAALDRVGLAGYGQRRPGALSGGQQARASLARVLLQAPDVMLLDEPFGALGPALKEEMLALVKEIAVDEGALTLLVSHEPTEVRALCDQIIWTAVGRVHGPSPTEDLFSAPPAPLRDYLGMQGNEKGRA